MKRIYHPQRLPVLVLGTVLALSLNGADPLNDAERWPQWLGPQRNGHVATAAWPSKLDDQHLRPLWKAALGPGYSGPIIDQERIYTTETRDKHREIVTAFNRTTGDLIWRKEWEGAMSVPFFAKANGDWIRSTPALDGDRLYVAGMRDVLVCLSTRDGQELWRVDFPKRFQSPLPAFGFVSSPLVDATSVYVQAGAAVVRLDKLTGETLWRSLADDGGMSGSAFASPVLATLGGRQQLLVQTRTKLAGLHPTDGRELWAQPIGAFRGMNILTPTVHGEAVFTSAYGGKSHLFQITRHGETWEVSPRWAEKTQGYMTTPVVVGHHAYQHLRNQRFRCVDLDTGKEAWMTDRGFGKYWSLVTNGESILSLDQDGTLRLIRASPEAFELVDSRKVSEEETWAHVALAGRTLAIRELGGLAVFAWENPR